MTPTRRNRLINAGSFAALIIGVATGAVLGDSSPTHTATFFVLLEFIGKAWIDLLLVVVIPVIVAYLAYLVLSFGQRQHLGSIATRAITVHVAVLMAGFLVSAPLSFGLIRTFSTELPGLDDFQAASKRIAEVDTPRQGGIHAATDLLGAMQGWLGASILALIILTLVLCLLWTKLDPDRSAKATASAKNIAETWLARLQLVLLSLPLAVFALIVPLVAKSGFALLSMIGTYLILICSVFVFCILLLYAAAGIWGNRSILDFASAVWPVQTIAFSSRSSLASLPAMMDAAENRLGVPQSVTAVVVPFFASSFRLHRAVSPPFKFLFINHVFDLELGLGVFLVFMLFQIGTSFISPGIPNGGDINLPIYIAFGIPLDAYMLLIAVNVLPDMIMTVMNVTSVMTVTSITAEQVSEIDEISTREVLETP